MSQRRPSRHPWGGHPDTPRRDQRSWSRAPRRSISADLDEPKTLEPSMSSRDAAPVCVALCGYDRMRWRK